MSISIDFSPEIEEALVRRAELVGTDVQTVIKELVSVQLAGEISPSKPMTPQEKIALLEKIGTRRPGVKSFVDDSRESIYAGRGE